jgi:hypothetical protein
MFPTASNQAPATSSAAMAPDRGGRLGVAPEADVIESTAPGVVSTGHRIGPWNGRRRVSPSIDRRSESGHFGGRGVGPCPFGT